MAANEGDRVATFESLGQSTHYVIPNRENAQARVQPREHDATRVAIADVGWADVDLTEAIAHRDFARPESRERDQLEMLVAEKLICLIRAHISLARLRVKGRECASTVPMDADRRGDFDHALATSAISLRALTCFVAMTFGADVERATQYARRILEIHALTSVHHLEAIMQHFTGDQKTVADATRACELLVASAEIADALERICCPML